MKNMERKQQGKPLEWTGNSSANGVKESKKTEVDLRH
jgi:hypothetical protein